MSGKLLYFYYFDFLTEKECCVFRLNFSGLVEL